MPRSPWPPRGRLLALANLTLSPWRWLFRISQNLLPRKPLTPDLFLECGSKVHPRRESKKFLLLYIIFRDLFLTLKFGIRKLGAAAPLLLSGLCTKKEPVFRVSGFLVNMGGVLVD